jgi:hypothetical protein
VTRPLILVITIVTGLLTQGLVWAGDLDCSKVVHVVSDSTEARIILENIERIINEHLNEKVKAIYRTIEKTGNWLIVEFDADKLEPGIFVLEQTKNTYKWAAEFGGGPVDDQEDAIQSYFIEKIPMAPKELFQCYSPKGAPFRNERK